MNEEELKQAMYNLINYCRNSKCENCIFRYDEDFCKIAAPSHWKGVEDIERL